jgi:hypothetical protein
LLEFSYFRIAFAWKRANVLPILKLGKDPTPPKNYRPISLLSTMDKLFERLIQCRLKCHINAYGICRNEQFGFRERYSIQRPISCCDRTFFVTIFGVRSMECNILSGVAQGVVFHPHCSTYSHLVFQNWMKYTWLFSQMTRPFSLPILRRICDYLNCLKDYYIEGWVELRLFSVLNAERANCSLRNCYLIVIQSFGRTVPNILA